MTSETSIDDVVHARPFIPVLIKPKSGRGPARRATRLNVTRNVYGGERYELLLIPYTEQERIGRRVARTRDVASFLPDVPGVEGVDYSARPARLRWPKNGHLQFVRADRIEISRESAPWAG